MFSRVTTFALGLATFAMATFATIAPAEAGNRDKAFFENVTGQ